MFRLVSDQQRRSSQKKLAQLLSDCIQVYILLAWEPSVVRGIISPTVYPLLGVNYDFG